MIAIASDHAGFALKEKIKKHLEELKFEVCDFGTENEESCDYPVFAKKACEAVVSGQCDRAILVCGTGIGMSMAANKIKGIRAAVCTETFAAKYTRLHNDANVLCMGARVIGEGVAIEITDTFITTEFEGGKHKRRIDMFE
ncbi:MAG: ribose 5-phosphate isomerase B [Clostridia bacterium]|nr:ribose 5-phosphate isomerase B [Clostridia bacterium]MBO5300167.1 ribose 5-phosphate isomerase B [Clostridia bacterium]